MARTGQGSSRFRSCRIHRDIIAGASEGGSPRRELQTRDLVATMCPPLTRLQGYSWGSLAAVHASPSDQGLTSTLIIAPALTPFRLLSLLHRPFTTALAALLPTEQPESAGPGTESALQRSACERVWMIYGTEDQFSGVGAFRAVVSDLQGRGLRGWEIEGGDHFFRGESGEELQRGIRAWLER